MEEIPEDLRCKRSDGKQWRCSALSMPDKTVCEKHYIQAKKRAANSALRASLKKARRGSVENNDTFLESKHNDPEMLRSLSPMNVDGTRYMKYKEKFGKSRGLYPSDTTGRIHGSSLRCNEGHRDVMKAEEDSKRSTYNPSYLTKEANNFVVDYHEKSSVAGEAGQLTCHQCQRNDGVNVVWCISCDRKGYCDNCISQWYADIPVEDIRKICPACRGICNCKVCLSGDNLIKTRVQEIAGIDKLRHLHSLLSFVLPVLKHIYSEQCFEIAVETRVHGMKTDIPRASIHADEQMCCNFCRTPIFDFHRHCPQCLYDLCLTCCRDLRSASVVADNGESTAEKRTAEKLMPLSNDENAIDFSHLFPSWKANTDGSIPCAPEEAGGCASSKLVLRRILKINWVAKLVKNAEEMVTGCKGSNPQTSDNCTSCNILYCPTSDLKHDGISHFQKHWVKGEPVIVKRVFDHSLASSWDPMSIWRGIQETIDERMPENSTTVKVTDYLSQSEVDIELSQFIKGYSEGLINEDGRPKMLMLRDWPAPNAWEEFIMCQRPEFLTNLPFIEFIHSKWGLLNLAAKLPHESTQTEAGPKIYISYGTRNELGGGDPVTKLHMNMGDLVYLLMHSTEAHNQGAHGLKLEMTEKPYKELNGEHPILNASFPNSDLNFDEKIKPPDMALKRHATQKESGLGLNNMEDQICSGSNITSVEKKSLNSSHGDDNCGDGLQKVSAGAIWDVFRRQDAPKLNEFLRVHWEEITSSPSQPVPCPVYEQSLYLDKHHKRKLKEEYGIEPWTFEQHVGEAVLVPAGCPFQVRNLQSTVQLGLDFLSPESLNVSVKMSQEIRCLPADHEAKLNMWEVGKMSLYAASSAIREVQKIVLDPKLSSGIKFEDRNLTAMVSQNLGRMSKRRQIACP
ncbi:uncharacterized protein A4U43_UnF9610 [Asparagus officinalis]|uniref:JmjC domain-containing protein n=1 Tax=Asparagus officinalis TaxID=4686 RepID=A0A1R3L5P8_ASPOF|nr:lysine-specific demethylase JMJ25 [Asparagus officinalis]ONK54928.1 uncharacterized protein A4U43_UnF9610 [Asparagus officinalis]